jgi:hypothetical protein
MTRRLRKFALTAHVTFAVGWLGADAGFLALAIVGLTSQNPQMVRAAYLSMELIGLFVIVPFSFAALLSGLVLALGTQWGLLRHYWILVKFLLTIGAIVVLLVHTNAMREAASTVSDIAQTLSGLRNHFGASIAGGPFGSLQLQLLVASAAGLLVLLVNTTLGLYKPRGLTRYGRRKQQERRTTPEIMADSATKATNKEANGEGISLRLKIAIAVIGLIVAVLVLLHLIGAGPGSHGR